MRNSRFQISLIFLFGTLLLNGCGPSAEEIAAAETKIAADIFATQTAAVPTATNTPLPTPTNTRKPTPNRTATAAIRATTTAKPMADLVQQLSDVGYLQSTSGEYLQIDDFQESFAMIDWVQSYLTDIEELNNFIIRSYIAWETAKRGANIDLSGCGFWFGVDKDLENFHEVIIALDGHVNFSRCLNNCLYIETIAKKYFGKIDYMQGEAELIIIVEGGTIRALINGEHILVLHNQKKLKGDLHYAISSGTNAGFGTRCTFTDTEIWSLEP
jgi:hypothetical protein